MQTSLECMRLRRMCDSEDLQRLVSVDGGRVGRVRALKDVVLGSRQRLRSLGVKGLAAAHPRSYTVHTYIIEHCALRDEQCWCSSLAGATNWPSISVCSRHPGLAPTEGRDDVRNFPSRQVSACASALCFACTYLHHNSPLPSVLHLSNTTTSRGAIPQTAHRTRQHACIVSIRPLSKLGQLTSEDIVAGLAGREPYI